MIDPSMAGLVRAAAKEKAKTLVERETRLTLSACDLADLTGAPNA